MDLKELTERLALGELKNTSAIDDADPSQLKEQHRLMVTNHLNIGLTNLYSKFILLEKELLLRTQIPITHYYLRKEFARSNSTVVPYKYIDDTVCGEYTEDLIKVLKVYNEMGEELYVDDDEQHESIFTPQYDCLQITGVHLGSMFSVIYQARHPVMKGTNPCQEIKLPFFFEEAIQAFVASKVLSHMNGQEHSAKGQEYMALYNGICAEAEMRDMVRNSVTTTNTKLEKRGFV